MLWILWQQCMGQPGPELQDSWVAVHLHLVLTLKIMGHQKLTVYGFHEPPHSSGPFHTAPGLQIPASPKVPLPLKKKVHLVPISQPG